MSSPFTADFLRRWGGYSGEGKNLLARIELTVPSARTLYLAKHDVVTPDGQLWEGRIAASEPVRFPGSYLSPGPDLATGGLTISTARLAYQTSGDVLDSLAAYRWQGATVTLWYWADGLTVNDAACIFVGIVDRVSPTYDPERGASVELGLVQDSSWDVPLPPNVVNRIDDPDAPEATLGVPKPIIYGGFTALNDKSPAGTPFGSEPDREKGGCGSGAVPSLIVARGVDSTKRTVLVADHALTTLVDRATGHSLFVAGGGQLDVVDDATGITSGGDGTYTIDDDSLFAWHGCQPSEVYAGAGVTNTAGNPRNALDVFDMTTYAVLDQGAGKNQLVLRMPVVGQLGAPAPGVATKVYVAWTGDAANTHNIQARCYYRNTAAYSAAMFSVASTGTSYTISSGNWLGGATPAWSLGGDGGTGATGQVELVVDFAGGAANKARIYWCAVPIKYTPYDTILSPAVKRFETTYKAARDWSKGNSNRQGMRPRLSQGGRWVTLDEEIAALSAMFYANPEGYADDGSGTFTGTASALVQVPPDIVRHLLVTYAGLNASSDFETTGGAFGSFVDARGAVRCEQPLLNYILSVYLAQRTTMGDALKTICANAMMRVQLDPLDSGLSPAPVWRAHVWRRGGRTDYDRTIEREDVQSITGPTLPSSVEVRNRLRVGYRYDWLRSRFWLEAFVNDTGSARGYNLPGVRDCKLTVSASNNKLDWVQGASTYADTLTSATYTTGLSLASDVRTQMRTHDAKIHVGYGAHVVAGYNDKIDFTVGASTYAVTLTAGEWSCVDLAEHAQDMLNAAGSAVTFTVTYDDATNLFTVAATGTFSLLAQTGANELTSALPILGWVGDKTAASTYTGDVERYHGRFWFYTRTATINVLWQSGTNAATNCGELLGWDRLTDVTGDNHHQASYQVNAHEDLCATSVAQDGERAEERVDALHVRNEATAQDFRNRLIEAYATPPGEIALSTYRMVDARRMQVFKTAASLDELVGCGGYGMGGTAGSWAGRKWRVVSVELGTGPFWGQRIGAVEAA